MIEVVGTSFRQRLGCWLHERWQAELVLGLPCVASRLDLDWPDLCNRHEELSLDIVGPGRVCKWQHSSCLTLVKVFPSVGQRLLARCLSDWRIGLEFRDVTRTSLSPKVSFLIAFGGSDRLRQFELALASLRAQSHPAFEIIVIEQSMTSILAGSLPTDVRYLHQEIGRGEGFNKSRALNAAARLAKGEYLLIQDADFLVPEGYAVECSRLLDDVDGVRPSRFIFYLDQNSTELAHSRRCIPTHARIEAVVQNTPAPLAVRAEAYWEIGGHDESFIGWGGEDVEFLNRLRTRDVAEGGWIPLVHLWHPPAAKKASGDRNQSLQDSKLSVSAEMRIAILRGQCLRDGEQASVEPRQVT